MRNSSGGTTYQKETLDMIISADELVRRNAVFAATGAFAGLAFPGGDTLQVLGCVDSRVDPGDVLGLELGEGVVMRNKCAAACLPACRRYPDGCRGPGRRPVGR
jgi:hypothetical protein